MIHVSNTRSIGLAALAALAAASSASAALSIVARSGQDFQGFTPTGFFQFPAVSNTGEVVFVGTHPDGSRILSSTRGIRLAPGDVVGGRIFGSAFGAHPDVNDFGDIAFTFRDTSSTTLIAAQSASGSTSILFNFSTDLVQGKTLGSIGQLATNNAGTVVFNSNFLDGSALGVFSPTAPVLATGMVIGGQTVAGINGVTADGLNNAGVVAVRVVTGTTTGPTRIATQDGFLASPGLNIGGRSIQTYNASISINDGGNVSFVGFYGGGASVFTLDREVLATGTVHGGRTIQNFDGDTAIDDAGRVALKANFAGGGSGIFFDDTLVLATGDVLDGLTVLSLGVPALNDAAQLAVFATFTDGSSAILAGTVPEPATAALLLGFGAVAAVAVLRRR